MKINDSTLARQLSQNLAPAYWVSGDEPLLVQECIDLIHQRFKKEGYAEKELLVVDNNFDPTQLLELTSNFSLFSEKKRIECQLSDKTPEAFTSTLNQCLQYDNPGVVFIVRSQKLSASQTKTKWYTTFEKAGCHITVWPVEANQLSGWIQQRGKKLGLDFTPDALTALAEFCEGNLLAAKQALEKLSLFQNDQPISLEEVLAFQADESRYNVFNLTSICLLGDAKKAWHILEHLRAENIETTLILWSLTKELRLLALLYKESRGQSLDGLFKRYQIWDKRQPEVRRALTRLSYAKCLSLLQEANKIDKMIKGVIREDPWEALQHFVIHISATQQPSL